jgi:hypothetical protein
MPIPEVYHLKQFLPFVYGPHSAIDFVSVLDTELLTLLKPVPYPWDISHYSGKPKK